MSSYATSPLRAGRPGLRGTLLLIGLLGACGSDLTAQSTPYLEAAREVGHWLTVQAAGDGAAPDEVEAGTPATWSLGTGAAGRALFFLELFRATGDARYRHQAVSEGAVLLASDGGEGEVPRLGLYSGLAGEAFALEALHRHTADARFQAALRDRLTRLQTHAAADPINDLITGMAGVGLTLLHLAEATADTALVVHARVLGDTLLQRGVPAEGGTYWKRAQHMDFNLPNFSHGAAGVGYFLARLYEVTGAPAYLQGAAQAARYLMAVADRSDGLFLVPYGIPNEGYTTPYDIGWAHGPAGTARLFYLLWTLTGDLQYRDVVHASARSLQAAGIPGPTADSLRWRGPVRIDQRFGTAGAVAFLLHLHRVRPDPAYAALGQALAVDILRQSMRTAEGRFWTLPRYGFQDGPGETATYTGYFYGAAGLGLALLQMHYAERGRAPAIAWPDDPFRASTHPSTTTDSVWVRSDEMGAPQYFAVLVEDVDRAVAWYRTVLDLHPRGGSAAENGTWRIENLANSRLWVELIRDHRAQPAERALGFRKVGFRVPDVALVADRVARATGTRPRVVDFEAHGVRILQLQDPEGNTLQLTSPLDP